MLGKFILYLFFLIYSPGLFPGFSSGGEGKTHFDCRAFLSWLLVLSPWCFKLASFYSLLRGKGISLISKSVGYAGWHFPPLPDWRFLWTIVNSSYLLRISNAVCGNCQWWTFGIEDQGWGHVGSVTQSVCIQKLSLNFLWLHWPHIFVWWPWW